MLEKSELGVVLKEKGTRKNVIVSPTVRDVFLQDHESWISL